MTKMFLTSNQSVEINDIILFLKQYHIKPNGFLPEHPQNIQETALKYINILDKVKPPRYLELRELLGDITGRIYVK